MILVGDIGGTKTNLALFAQPLKVSSPAFEMTYKSVEFRSLSEVASTFLSWANIPEIDVGVFACAGPVIDGSVQITNLPWIINESELQTDLNIEKIRLINDLEAIANSVPYLSEGDLQTLHQGRAEEEGTIAVIAPGTGLGEAFLTWSQGEYHAYASEGGHTDFGPTSQQQLELLAYMRKSYAHVSYERLCSGLGIPNIYSFLRSGDVYQEPAWLTKQLADADDPTPVIVEAAGNEKVTCQICEETIRIFISILGAECGNLALKFKASGGIYIAGGMLPKMKNLIDFDEFNREYENKGRFQDFVARIPVRLITHPEPAIVGAAHYAVRRYL
jgi:glucokinase